MDKHFPSNAEIIEYVMSQAGFVLRRDIARAFRIKGSERRHLKEVLKEIELKGQLERKGKSYRSKLLPEFMVVKYLGEGSEGEFLACPVHDAEENYFQTIVLDAGPYKLTIGDKLMVKIAPTTEGHYIGHVLRKLEVETRTIVGVLTSVNRGQYVLQPVDRRDRNVYPAVLKKAQTVQNGSLVEAELTQDHRTRRLKAIVQDVLEDASTIATKFSWIAIHNYDLPYKFSPQALAYAAQCQLPDLEGRVDLRHLPLVTIDDEDARDHDDAVWAQPDVSPQNKGGWHVIVAIADVSYFVKPGAVLDHEALARATSVYFPDQVIPMLPEQLSNELCSLKPEVDRPCLAVDLYINQRGELIEFKFYKAMMRSHGKLTYQQVQAVIEKKTSSIPQSLQDNLIPQLYKAYTILKRARERRGTLELEIPEQKIELSPEGQISKISLRSRFESHELIEEMMILANVAAAGFLAQHKLSTLYRIHETPAPEKVEELRMFLKGTPFSLPKGQVLLPLNFNHILKKAAGTPSAVAIHELILRAQAQAEYNPVNVGHFGLNLPAYCHFTSPIRRYADLIVHRGISSILEKDRSFYPYSLEVLEGIGEEVSEKQRRADRAERETIERYLARFLEKRVGDVLTAKISNITEFAVFLRLEETGASGILPLRNLTNDYYQLNPQGHTLTGRRTKHQLTIGDLIEVRLEQTNSLTGSLIFSAAFVTPSKREKFKRKLKNSKFIKN